MALGLRLPGNQNLAAGRNIARDEALGGGGKELVEAGLKDSEIKVAFRIPPERPSPNFAASWNVAPTDPLPVVRYDAKDHQRSLEVMRWG